MIQQSEYDVTGLIVELKGLSENSGYHVHMVMIDHIYNFVKCTLIVVFS